MTEQVMGRIHHTENSVVCARCATIMQVSCLACSACAWLNQASFKPISIQ